MKKLILVHCFLSFISFAQINNQFTNYLPEKIKKGANIEFMNEMVTIHPILIYYYIESLNMRVDSKDSDRHIKANQFLISAIKYYENERLKWQKNFISIINNSSYDEKIKDELTGYINPVDNPQNESQNEPEHYDKNYADFYQYIYFNSNHGFAYIDSVNYELLKEQYKKIFKSLIINECKNLGNFDELLDNWFLFPDDSDLKTLTDLMSGIIEYYYSTINQPRLSIALGIKSEKNTYHLSDEIPGIFPIQRNYEYTSQKMIGYSVSLSYKYYIRDYVSFLAYADIQASIFYSLINGKVKTEPGYVKDLETGLRESLKFKKNEAELKNIKGMSFCISIPAIFIGNYLSFNVGGQASYYYAKFNTKLNYENTVYAPVFWAPEIKKQYFSGDVSREKSENHLEIVPVIGVGYNYKSGILIKAELSPNHFLAAIGYSIF